MNSIAFKFLKDDRIQEVSYDALFKNKKILICSLPRYHEFVNHRYVRYVNELKDRYKDSCNLDAAYIVNSSPSSFFLRCGDSFWPNILSLHDESNKFLNYLKNLKNRPESLKYLSKNWSYQALFIDKNLELFAEQPMQKRHEEFLNFLKKTGEIQRLLKLEEKSSVVTLRGIFKNSEEYAYERPINFSYNEKTLQDKINYYKLWPNKTLEEYLSIGKKINF
jgi:hypothetical protein